MEPSNITNLQILLQAFVLSFCWFSSGLGSAGDTINISLSIQDPESIVSNGQTFMLGFFSSANASSHRYVGIMYNIPLLTVVWVANRDKPLTESTGTVTISEDGNLVILDGNRVIIWSSNVSNPVANSSAQLLDSGNLVLRDNSNGKIIWESFQDLTDSLLQKMELGRKTITDENKMMTSWKSPSDPSKGTFSAGLQPLNIPQIFIWNGSHPYWRSGPFNGQIFIGVRSMQPLYRNGFFVTDDKEGAVSLSFMYLNTSILMYFMLDSAGSFVERYWEDGKEDWEATWSIPENRCDVYGTCGSNGICDPQGSPICTCLPGFGPRKKDEWSLGDFTSGCIRKTALQCERNNSIDDDGKQDGFLKLQTVKVPDFAELAPTLKDGCATSCLEDCSCIAYAYYSGIGCMHWRQNLIDIQKFPKDGAELYLRLPYSELDDSKDVKVVVTAAIVTIGSITIASCGYLLWKWLARHKGRRKINGLRLSRKGLNLVHPYERFPNTINQYKLEELPIFDLDSLAYATNNFHSTNKLGQGGFGPVYKGQLPGGQEIAVKRLSRSSSQGVEEFMNEVVVISKLQHRNLVRLRGCCTENEEKMLIYEFMSNGSLDAYIFDPQKHESLTWSQRTRIIEGIGRGLLYLHRDSRLKIIHRDLKASNILLDKELNPKISDFGMARIFGSNEEQANTRRVVGTYGYMAPEYAMEGRFSEKSDVYSFGVLLLEIVSGRKNTSFYENEQALSLLAFAWKTWNDREVIQFVDPILVDQLFRLEMLRYVHVGLLCVQESANDRPNVSTILSMLSREIADLPSPKLPAFIGRRNSVEEPPLAQNPTRFSANELTVSIVEGR